MHSVLYFELVAFCIVVEVMMFVKMRFGLYRLLYQRTFRNVLVLSTLSMSLDYLRLAGEYLTAYGAAYYEIVGSVCYAVSGFNSVLFSSFCRLVAGSGNRFAV